jgi:hypothetical protein
VLSFFISSSNISRVAFEGTRYCNIELISAKLTGAAGDVERLAEQVSVASMWCHSKLEVLCSAEVSSSIIFLWSIKESPTWYFIDGEMIWWIYIIFI